MGATAQCPAYFCFVVYFYSIATEYLYQVVSGTCGGSMNKNLIACIIP